MYVPVFDGDPDCVSVFHVKDSGATSEYADGMRRDSTEGKPRFDLLIPTGMPYEETLLYRAAMHYMLGGKKYGDRNWEKSRTAESLGHHTEALWRHFMKFVSEVEDGEDHAAAIFWNLNAVLYTKWRMSQPKSLTEADAPNNVDDEADFSPAEVSEGAWGAPDSEFQEHVTKAFPQEPGPAFSANSSVPKFGTPEFDAKAAEVAAEQAESWPRVPEDAVNPSDDDVLIAEDVLRRRQAFYDREASELWKGL